MATDMDLYYPFDAGAGSSITEAQWAKFARHLLPSGVLRSYENELEVYADATGMQVKVKTGAVWIRGHYGEITAIDTIAIESADPSNPRIDLVVAKVDWANNKVQIDIVKGTAAASPSIPSLTRNSSIYEVALAQVLVGTGVSTIAADKVTDERSFAWAGYNSSHIVGGRLTLESGVAVSISDQADKTEVLYTPHLHRQISLYDDDPNVEQWRIYDFEEVSFSVASLTASKNRDVFGYWEGGLQLETVEWTDDTNRATALATQDGILVKAGSPNKRYLGSIRVDSGQKCQDTLLKRYCWNYYNQTEKQLKVTESTASWSYTTNAFRAANASNDNRVSFIIGVAGSKIDLSVHAFSTNSGAAYRLVGIGLDAVDTSDADLMGLSYIAGNDNMSAHYVSNALEGFHYLQWVEKSYTTTGTTTWYGTYIGLSGMIGIIKG